MSALAQDEAQPEASEQVSGQDTGRSKYRSTAHVLDARKRREVSQPATPNLQPTS
jgi:hypothetical protein